jgi:hypothetical protein
MSTAAMNKILNKITIVFDDWNTHIIEEFLKVFKSEVVEMREMTLQGHHEDRIFFSGYNDGLARVVELIDEMIGEDNG